MSDEYATADMRMRQVKRTFDDMEIESPPELLPLVKFANEVAVQTLVSQAADKNRLKQQLTLKYGLVGASPPTKARLLAALNVNASMGAEARRKALGSTERDTKAVLKPSIQPTLLQW